MRCRWRTALSWSTAPPPCTGHALPLAYRTLMVHPSSPIIDFYPIDFANDLNGKKFSWQAIALLPFIDAKRLRAALAPLKETLTEVSCPHHSTPAPSLRSTPAHRAYMRARAAPRCLLYTSPSPRDRNVSRMPSSA